MEGTEENLFFTKHTFSKQPPKSSKIVEFSAEENNLKGKGFYHKGVEYIHHSDLPHEESAFFRLSGWQIFFGLLFIGILIASLVIAWKTTLIYLIAFLTLIYFADLLFNLFLIVRSF